MQKHVTILTILCRLINLMSDPKMAALLIYWTFIIYILLFIVDIQKVKVKRTILRKYFHLIAVLLFVPTIIYNVSSTYYVSL